VGKPNNFSAPPTEKRQTPLKNNFENGETINLENGERRNLGDGRRRRHFRDGGRKNLLEGGRRNMGMEKEQSAIYFSHNFHSSLSLPFTHFCHESTLLSLLLSSMANVKIVQKKLKI